MYKEDEARKLVIEAGLELIKNELIARTWGNISARISENEFVITPSGKPYETLKAEDLVKVNINDLSYEGSIKPSSEKGIHANGYKLRSDINFIIHTHQNYATAISLKKDNGFVPVCKYGLPSTKKLSKNVKKEIEKNIESNSFLLSRHGVMCFGKTYEDAFNEAMSLENKAIDYYNKFANNLDASNLNIPLLDDYAQMFGNKNKPLESENNVAIDLIKKKERALKKL